MNLETNKDISDAFKYIAEALVLIKRLQSNFGEIDCPKCKNKLVYRRAKNGHVWGKCTTDNCLSWMQ